MVMFGFVLTGKQVKNCALDPGHRSSGFLVRDEGDNGQWPPLFAALLQLSGSCLEGTNKQFCLQWQFCLHVP